MSKRFVTLLVVNGQRSFTQSATREDAERAVEGARELFNQPGMTIEYVGVIEGEAFDPHDVYRELEGPTFVALIENGERRNWECVDDFKQGLTVVTVAAVLLPKAGVGLIAGTVTPEIPASLRDVR